MESRKGSEKIIRWLGDSKENLLAFPDDVKNTMGYALRLAQNGGKHVKATPLRGDKFTGSSVMEIVYPFNTDAFRVVYFTKSKKYIYVLHAFKKKSTIGIKTPKKEMDLIEERLKQAQTLEKEDSHAE